MYQFQISCDLIKIVFLFLAKQLSKMSSSVLPNFTGSSRRNSDTSTSGRHRLSSSSKSNGVHSHAKILDEKSCVIKCNNSPEHNDVKSEEDNRLSAAQTSEALATVVRPESKTLPEINATKSIASNTLEGVTRQLIFDEGGSGNVPDPVVSKISSGDGQINQEQKSGDTLQCEEQCSLKEDKTYVSSDCLKSADTLQTEIDNRISNIVDSTTIAITANLSTQKSNHHQSLEVSEQHSDNNNNNTSSSRHRHHSHHQRHHHKGSSSRCSTSNSGKHTTNVSAAGAASMSTSPIPSESSYQKHKCSKCYKRSKIRRCNVGIQCVCPQLSLIHI